MKYGIWIAFNYVENHHRDWKRGMGKARPVHFETVADADLDIQRMFAVKQERYPASQSPTYCIREMGTKYVPGDIVKVYRGEIGPDSMEDIKGEWCVDQKHGYAPWK